MNKKERDKLYRDKYSKSPEWKAKRVLYQKKYRDRDLHKFLVKEARARAKRNNIPFDITYTDIDIPMLCPVLGITFDRNISEYRPSLDRVINDKGYIKGNVAIISRKANRLKQDNTIETLEAIIKYMKGYIDEKE